MLPRSLPLLALLAGGVLAGTAAADRLLVAGPDGVVLQATTGDETFETFAVCSGPVRALACDEERLFAADDLGQLFVFEREEGAPLGVLQPAIGAIRALATADGALFAGTEDGLVVRVDRQTGLALEKRAVPGGVRAMLALDGFLFVTSTDSGIYRAPAAGGDFAYFSCFCFFNVQMMAADRGELVVADEFGTVARIDAVTGEVLTAFFLNGAGVLGLSKRALLLYYEGGPIPRVDAVTGAPLPGGFTSPLPVDVMLVIDTPPLAKRLPRRLDPR